MKTPRFNILWQAGLAVALAVLTGCTTLKYREVQSRFDQVVRADNERFDSPFSEVSSRYESIADELSSAYIAKLDPRLQPNAWTLRAVSEWRAGEYAQSLKSVGNGQAAIEALKEKSPKFEHSRDAVLLTMLPGLVEDSRLLERFKVSGAADVAANYGYYASRFHTALRALAEARGKMTPVTPPEVRHYWNYQCWRVLENWQIILSKLPLDEAKAPNDEADLFVKANLGGKELLDASTLPEAIQNAEDGLPEGSSYRKLIELERQR